VSDSSRTTETDLDARVLGRLLLAESALHALPDVERVAGFLCEAMRSVPGVAGAALCFEGRLIEATDGWQVSPGQACPRPLLRCERCVFQPAGTTVLLFPVRTTSVNYGQLALLVSDAAALGTYAPYVQNVANVAAVSMENRLQQHRLADLNERLRAKLRELESTQSDLRRVQTGLEETVTERTAELRRAYDSLRESEARLLLAQEAANVGIWEWDMAAQVLHTSGTAQHMLGARNGEGVTIEHLFSRIHTEDVTLLRDAVLTAIAARTSIDVRFRVVLEGGEIRWLYAQGRPEYGPDGRATRVVGIDLDVTDRRRLEDELLQATKLESIGRLAGGVAHDFNNLLTVILGSAELGRDRPAETQESLEEIIGAARRAVELTRQLLAFARRQATRPRTVDVNEELRSLGRMLTRLIGENIEISLGLAPDLWPVSIDPGHLGQILTNLATNARDAMPRGGRLRIETHNRPFDAEALSRPGPQGDHIAIAVSDTGEGMSHEVRSHLFEPFFTTKNEGHGTGLGLASSYGLAAQAGGDIEVTSELGHGSTFTVLLPRAVCLRESATPPRPLPPPPRHGQERVLIVDDEAAVRRVAARCLSGLGYRIVEAANGRDALALVNGSAETIDVLVTDVVMPGLSGPELAQALRERAPDLRVLFVSGYAPDALGAGQEFLGKPFTGEELATRVRELLGDTGTARR
jgi:PAS domain S-box-containing protein